MKVKHTLSLSKDFEVNQEEMINQWETLEGKLKRSQSKKEHIQVDWDLCSEGLEHPDSIVMFVNSVLTMHLAMKFDDVVWESNPGRDGPKEREHLRQLPALSAGFLTGMEEPKLYHRKTSLGMDDVNRLLKAEQEVNIRSGLELHNDLGKEKGFNDGANTGEEDLAPSEQENMEEEHAARGVIRC